jgi:hypothetical protein
LILQQKTKRLASAGRAAATPAFGSRDGGDTAPAIAPSVLFREPSDRDPERPDNLLEVLVDLNLDQVIAAATAGKEEYDLVPFFHLPLGDLDDIAFRHEVMRELEQPRLLENIKAFAASMREVREHLAQREKLYYRRQKERWFLDAVNIYGDAVLRLGERLSAAALSSRGLSAFQDYLARYAKSEPFVLLLRQTKKLIADLGTVHYTVLIKGDRVKIRRYDGEADYSAEVEATFEKFRQGAGKDFVFKLLDVPEMDHVEAAILDRVAQLYPEIFGELESYCWRHKDFLDPVIARFDREIQFYIAYLDYIAAFRRAGLVFCYPRVTQASKEVRSRRSFDLALAGKLMGDRKLPVCNDFHLKGRERIIVVSGPNQGGKTTFARTFGQLHYLASLGCLVPGEDAQLLLFDRLFTHFEREENIANLRGKLEDDIVRAHRILEQATPRSIVIMNEIFTSTTFRDASLLSRRIAARLMALDLLCVWVTFVDELASLGPQTVSMVSTVVPENPAERTFRIVRRPADGLAYALAIAEKYRLTYNAIKERVAP